MIFSGNIAMHLFTPEKRSYYDLETLWGIGSDFDQPDTSNNSLDLDQFLSQNQEWMDQIEILDQKLKKK